MSEEIKPALTAEEWEKKHYQRDGVWIVNSGGGGGALALGFDGKEGVGIGDEDAHAAAALALHGQPFGFTWADVDGLRLAAAYWHAKAETAEYEPVQDRRAWLLMGDGYDNLADRIEALLPPRK